ncbi:MAG: hypothetical protein QOJ13_691 [Gaiellales bacterium]|jgi:AcrR family transcriptional regulator|nr:hypothetical protein [Gaiellales bacterium]
MSEAPPTKELRRDAKRNRERIVATARELFAGDGIEASVEDITRQAGVGMGTLYRHFATKEELIDAVLEDAFDELIALAEEAIADDDAWRGFTTFLEQTLERHVANRGLKDVVASAEHGRERAHAMRERLRPLVRQMIERAQAQGALRRDFTAEDVPVLFWAGGGVIAATATVAPDAWRRQLRFCLDGLQPAAATPLTVPPLTRDQLDRSAGRGRA